MNKMRLSTKRNKKKLEILELKNTVGGWKDSLEGFNSRFMQAEERNSSLKDRRLEIIKFKEQQKGMFSLRNKIHNKANMSAFTTSCQHYTEYSRQCNNGEIKGIQVGKEDLELSDIITNLENAKEFTKHSYYNQ